MRGALPDPGDLQKIQRIIPADAGSTRSSLYWMRQAGDHPRRCGEHLTKTRYSQSFGGSSPQMRGAPCPAWPSASPSRIIPADAGSTGVDKSRSPSQEDHPRRCGEHHPYYMIKAYQWGSSPQMRGARCPAPLRCHRIRDHPRRCGEHDGGGRYIRFAEGSSPQMRGALSHYPIVGGNHRIIPADAGSTQNHIRKDYPCKDHPRRCGEHKKRHLGQTKRIGSSPQMRGALRKRSATCPRLWIIPADAGSTRPRFA